MQEKVCHCKKVDEKVSFDKYTIKFRNKPRAYIFQRPFLRGLSTEGNLCFKIDRVNFTIFALFYFVVEGNFPSTWGSYIWRGGFTEG